MCMCQVRGRAFTFSCVIEGNVCRRYDAYMCLHLLCMACVLCVRLLGCGLRHGLPCFAHMTCILVCSDALLSACVHMVNSWVTLCIVWSFSASV